MKSMHAALGLGAFLVLAVAPSAGARDVACGEACDTKMNQCVEKCPKRPTTEAQEGPYDVACWNECAKKVFHPCLDACRDPKPPWAKE